MFDYRLSQYAHPVGMNALLQLYPRLVSNGMLQHTQRMASLNTVHHGEEESQKRGMFFSIYSRSPICNIRSTLPTTSYNFSSKVRIERFHD